LLQRDELESFKSVIRGKVMNEIQILFSSSIVSRKKISIWIQFNVGLVKIGQMVGEEIPYPRRKVTILVMGNHSAGKSSFINWYVQWYSIIIKYDISALFY